MITSIQEGDSHIHHGVTGEGAVLHRLAHPFFYCRNILPRYVTPPDRIDKLKAAPRGFWLNP